MKKRFHNFKLKYLYQLWPYRGVRNSNSRPKSRTTTKKYPESNEKKSKTQIERNEQAPGLFGSTSHFNPRGAFPVEREIHGKARPFCCCIAPSHTRCSDYELCVALRAGGTTLRSEGGLLPAPGSKLIRFVFELAESATGPGWAEGGQGAKFFGWVFAFFFKGFQRSF